MAAVAHRAALPTSRANQLLRLSHSTRHVECCCQQQLKPNDQVCKPPAVIRLALFGIAASLCLLGHSPAASAFGEDRVERDELIQQQQKMLEYALEQQRNVQKAELLSKRLLLQTQINLVEDQIGKKLNEQEANVVGATAAGDAKRAEVIQQEEALIRSRELDVQLAAAKLEGRLDRMELLQRAKEVAQMQEVERAAQELQQAFKQAMETAPELAQS